MDYSIVRVRNLNDSAAAWEEMMQYSRLKAYAQEDDFADEKSYTDEEVDLNKSILAGFIKSWTLPIEQEILEEDLNFEQREVCHSIQTRRHNKQ